MTMMTRNLCMGYHKMSRKLLVGLGNPGAQYKNTRHNVGFILVDTLVAKLSLQWKFEKKFNSDIASNSEYIFAKPQTFMNQSGSAVKKLVTYFGTNLNDLIVIHDDVDIEAGDAKFKKGSSSAGHHGVEDIIEKLGTKDFWRLRVGIGRPEDNVCDVHSFVLGNLSDDFADNFTELLSKTELKITL